MYWRTVGIVVAWMTLSQIFETCNRVAKRFQDILFNVCCRQVSPIRVVYANRLIVMTTVAAINNFAENIEKVAQLILVLLFGF